MFELKIRIYLNEIIYNKTQINSIDFENDFQNNLILN